MLLVLVHLRCVGAIFTGGRHHPRARSCAGLGHHCALAATVPNDPAFIDGAREALSEAVASACVVVSGRCEGCATCVSLNCDSTSQVMVHLAVLKDLEALDLRISLAQMKPET